MTQASSQTAASSASSPAYVGRFAPSPTGPLHFGSLVAALASYLHAHHAGGRWLVRMEDLDPPREQPGADSAILASLEAHGLHWDGEVLFQSTRLAAYEHALEQLLARDLVYPCTCTRKAIRAMGGLYNGHCRRHRADTDAPYALRLKLTDLPAPYTGLPDTLAVEDIFQGRHGYNLRTDADDTILRRKDGLHAYQLAVVVDDIAQGITHSIRGADLLPITGAQSRLFELLDAPVPHFGHVPMALHPQGDKLSKQTHAPALQAHRAGENLWHALRFLGQNPPAELRAAPPGRLLEWAKSHWRANAVQGTGHAVDPETGTITTEATPS
ncbi:tRNA glutamyl-Q(34) synthetase GluQRS [Marinimicrobium alkaliphilum]|uniref:tRNA glutamyl-Q(34) synthetase GluQRS n=1 Tax=Marinimicrobium alkaliphilum TaxID=2202654 RepID=UPI000DB9EB2B|nr:tRNA glutamyl-Q(34) synthetase GluQRS [Marinimicrobium alkaliphilum]